MDGMSNADPHGPKGERAACGVFGSPPFFVGDQMFFGNDRLEFVRDATKAAT
jgi:2-hydroxychromene-2-carboxylate isomerase